MSISWKASLPIRAAGHVAGDRDHRHRVEQRRPDAGDEVRGARAGGAHAHADPAGHPGVAVGGVRAALLVADEDVAQLGVVAQDVVERQDHPARVAEEDVDALAQQRLAQDVRPDAGPLEVAPLVEHLLAGALDGGRLRPSRRSARGCAGRRSAPLRRPRPALSPDLPLAIVMSMGPPCRSGSCGTRKTLAVPARVLRSGR